MFLVLILNLVLCLTNLYFAQSDLNFIPFSTYKYVNENDFTVSNGFGVSISTYQYNGAEPQPILRISEYNVEAGTISNWGGEMTLSDYEAVKEDLEAVNGIIVDSDMHEEYIIYTFNNKEKLTVKFVEAITKKYEHIIPDNEEPVETWGTDTESYEKYANGMLRINTITYSDEFEAFTIKSNYHFDIVGFLISYAVSIIIIGGITFLYFKIKGCKKQ